MGNAVSADVSDVSANYYNPAGLARARGLELSLGYFRASHHLSTNDVDNQVDPVKGLVFTTNGHGWLTVYVLAPVLGASVGGGTYRALFR